MNALPPVLLFLPFLIMGMRTLRSAMQGLFSMQIHRGLLSEEKGSLKGIFSGIFGTVFLLSTSIYNRLIINLLQGRLIEKEKALHLSLGGLIGSIIVVIPFLHTDPLISLIIMLIGSLGVLWIKQTRINFCAKALFGIGLVYCGLSLGDHFFSKQGIQIDPWIALLCGFGVSTLLRSSSIALIVGLWALSYGNTVAPFMYGAGTLLGGGLPELKISFKGNVDGRRLGFFIFIQRVLASVLGVLAALWLADKEGNITKIDGFLFYGFIILLSTFIILCFKKFLTSIAEKLFSEEEYPEDPKLEISIHNEDTTPAIALIQARRQVGKMANIVERTFSKVREYLKQERNPRVLAKIKDYERVTDNMKEEVEGFLMVVMQKPLSESETKEMRLLLRLVSDLESIADYLDKIATYRTKLEEEQKIPDDLKTEFFVLYDEVEKYFHHVMGTLGKPDDELRKKLDLQSQKLRTQLVQMREDHVMRLEKAESSVTLSMTYSDMVVALRKIRGHTRHISNALEL